MNAGAKRKISILFGDRTLAGETEDDSRRDGARAAAQTPTSDYPHGKGGVAQRHRKMEGGR